MTRTATAAIERPEDRADECRVRLGRARFLAIPRHRFVMVDGSGPPEAGAFEARMPGLYAVAYGLRFTLKRRGVIGKVGPLEGLWGRTDGSTDLNVIFGPDRDAWGWTLMIVLPEEATDAEVEEHLEAGRAKMDPDLALSLRAESFEEGAAAQVLHLGPYSEERPSVERLHEAIGQAGFRPRGRHHELYLGDPRRSAPERLRTILRQPIQARSRRA